MSVHQTFSIIFFKQSYTLFTCFSHTCFLWFHLLNTLHMSLMHHEVMYGNTARWSLIFWFEGSCACVLGFRLHSASCPAGIWMDYFGFDLGHFNVYGLCIMAGVELVKASKALVWLCNFLIPYTRPYKVCHIHTHAVLAESLLCRLRQNLSHWMYIYDGFLWDSIITSNSISSAEETTSSTRVTELLIAATAAHSKFIMSLFLES